jgi:hypothetical protein
MSHNGRLSMDNNRKTLEENEEGEWLTWKERIYQ